MIGNKYPCYGKHHDDTKQNKVLHLSVGHGYKSGNNIYRNIDTDRWKVRISHQSFFDDEDAQHIQQITDGKYKHCDGKAFHDVIVCYVFLIRYIGRYLIPLSCIFHQHSPGQQLVKSCSTYCVFYLFCFSISITPIG